MDTHLALPLQHVYQGL